MKLNKSIENIYCNFNKHITTSYLSTKFIQRNLYLMYTLAMFTNILKENKFNNS